MFLCSGPDLNVLYNLNVSIWTIFGYVLNSWQLVFTFPCFHLFSAWRASLSICYLVIDMDSFIILLTVDCSVIWLSLTLCSWLKWYRVHGKLILTRDLLFFFFFFVFFGCKCLYFKTLSLLLYFYIGEHIGSVFPAQVFIFHRVLLIYPCS